MPESVSEPNKRQRLSLSPLHIESHSKEEVVEHLNLEKHPEGGFFRQTFESDFTFPNARNPDPVKTSDFTADMKPIRVVVQKHRFSSSLPTLTQAGPAPEFSERPEAIWKPNEKYRLFLDPDHPELIGVTKDTKKKDGSFKETVIVGTFKLTDLTEDMFARISTCATSIYFLLSAGDKSQNILPDVSKLHQLTGQQDEMWHHYSGRTLEIIEIEPESGALKTTRLGKNIFDFNADGSVAEVMQYTVKAGNIFGSRVYEGSASSEDSEGPNWSIVSCTCFPGFDFSEFEMPSRKELVGRFEQHETVIRELTKDDEIQKVVVEETKKDEKVVTVGELTKKDEEVVEELTVTQEGGKCVEPESRL